MDTQVQQVKDRVNIVEIIGQYVQLKKAGRNYTARCPFHKERTPSFMVSPERGTYICFGCGEKGDVFSFVQKMDGTDFATVLKQLADKAGIKLERRAPQDEALRGREKEKEERLREVCEAAVSFFEGELQKHADVKDYLKTRGVSDESVGQWRIGYAPASWEGLSRHLVSLGFAHPDIVDAGFGLRSEKRPGEIFDRFRGRIMFPIFDVAGQPIAVSGRFFEKVAGQRDDGAEPAKYINSPETLIFKKSRTLYGFDKARNAIRRADCILLVEGQFDLVMAHQSGLPFAVALSGTALTPEHLSLLSRVSKRLVLALDADQAGVRAGLKSALMAIVAGFDVKVPTFAAGKDPADVARENPELLKAAVRTSKTAIEFFLDALRPQAKDERGYQKIVEANVLPLVAAVGSAIEREHFIRLVASRLHVGEEAVRGEVAKRPVLADVVLEASSPLQQQGADSLTPLEKKAAMLLAYFGARESDAGATRTRLLELLGENKVMELEKKIEPDTEPLRFKFEAEVGEHSDEATIARDMLDDIGRGVGRERFKRKFL